MRTLHIEAIVVCDRRDNGIGHANTLPWKLPKDMKRFKELTTGNAVLMGSQTAHSIGKALPRRQNYVLTRAPVASVYDGMVPVMSIQDAVNRYLALTEGQSNVELFICGGEEVYHSMIPYLTGLHLTFVYEPPSEPHDRWFPLKETLDYHGVREDFFSGHWINDGADEKISTYSGHMRFSKPSGPPLLSLPSDVQLGYLL